MSYKSKDVMAKRDHNHKPACTWVYGEEQPFDPNDVVEPCCEDWLNAHKPRSDCEGVGALVTYLDDGPLIGSLDKPVKFCPWCGAKKGKE